MIWCFLVSSMQDKTILKALITSVQRKATLRQHKATQETGLSNRMSPAGPKAAWTALV